MTLSPLTFLGVAAVVVGATVVTTSTLPKVNTVEIPDSQISSPFSPMPTNITLMVPVPIPSSGPPPLPPELASSLPPAAPTTPVTTTSKPTAVTPTPSSPETTPSAPPTSEVPSPTGNPCSVGLVLDPVLGVCVRI